MFGINNSEMNRVSVLATCKPLVDEWDRSLHCNQGVPGLILVGGNGSQCPGISYNIETCLWTKKRVRLASVWHWPPQWVSFPTETMSSDQGLAQDIAVSHNYEHLKNDIITKSIIFSSIVYPSVLFICPMTVTVKKAFFFNTKSTVSSYFFARLYGISSLLFKRCGQTRSRAPQRRGGHKDFLKIAKKTFHHKSF